MLYHKKNYKGINSNDEIKYMKNYSEMHIVFTFLMYQVISFFKVTHVTLSDFKSLWVILTNYITNITFM